MATPVVREVRGREEWNTLVVGLPNYDLRQGYEWGEVRASQGWIPRRIAVFQGGACVAAASFLARRLPVLGWSILYVPGGPLLLDASHGPAWDGLVEGIRSVATQVGAAFLRVNPRVPNEEVTLREALVARGFRHLPDDWTMWNSPRIVMTTDLRDPEEALRRKLRKRYREYIASALKRGVIVRRAVSLEEAWEFHASLATVGRREGLPVRGRAYFERLWKEYVRPGLGVLLLAECHGKPVGGLLGVKLGQKATMLYVTLRERTGKETLHQGPLLYWEFIRWAKKAGCDSIDWGGIGTNFPPREDDPGFGLYHFKLGFNSSLEYLSGYYDLVFSPAFHGPFRFLERWGSKIAWSLRAKLNGRFSEARALFNAARRKARQFRISVGQRGIMATLYWAAFGYLRPNRFIVFARDLPAGEISWAPREGIRIEVWEASAVRVWRHKRRSLSPEFFQDEIDGVDICAVALARNEVAGLIWIYRPGDASRLFRLRELEADLNNGYVLPEYRGMGLFRDILSFSCLWLRKLGYKTVYAGVHSNNEPSLRAFRSVEFRDIGSVRHFGFFRPRFREGAPRTELSSARAAGEV